MLPIAQRELVQIVRSRAVLINSLVMPVAAAAFFIYYRDVFEKIDSLGYIGAVIVFTIAAFSLYATTVPTLAGRRQSLFLKRLRSTAAPTLGWVVGAITFATRLFRWEPRR
jgi:ABC-2 type transport system permease protein